MRTIIVIFFFLVSSSFCFCQECKFNKKEIIDEISGFPVLVQNKQNKNINRPGAIAVDFFYSTNRCWINLNLLIQRGGLSQEMNFNYKTPIVFTFIDSSYLQLFPSMEYNSSRSSNLSESTLMYGLSGMIASTQTFHVFYDVSKENVELLASKEIQRIRINYSPFATSIDVNQIKDSTKITVLYKENRPSSFGKKFIKSSSKCILSVDFKDTDSCRQYYQNLKAKNEQESDMNSAWYNQTDSSKFSMIYIVFDDGQDESQSFPIYFNNKYICTLKNHMRLSYKLFSYGPLSIERREKNKVGPSTKLLIKSGGSYGVSIRQPNQQVNDPIKRFTIKLKSGLKFEEFMKNEFHGFKPFKKCDLIMQEDLKDPILM